MLRAFFSDFVTAIKEKERIVLIEEGNWLVMGTEEEAIQKYGEMAFVRFLAEKESIICACSEPPTRLLYLEFKKVFFRDEVQYYYFARICYQ
jgi:hypothetical protein